MTIPWQPGYQGNMVTPPGYDDPHTWAPAAALQLVAATPAAGFALQNGTPTILTWVVPNDGALHTLNIVMTLHVTSLETGGQITVTTTDPSGTAANPVAFAGGAAAGSTPQQYQRLLQAGSTVTLAQTSALTAGAASIWAQIWAA